MTTPRTKPNHADVDLTDKGNQLNINYHRSFIGLANPNPIPNPDANQTPTSSQIQKQDFRAKNLQYLFLGPKRPIWPQTIPVVALV